MSGRSATLCCGLFVVVAAACGRVAGSGPAALAVRPVASGAEARGDVLIVLLDDVGKDALALYGAESPARTPVLDRLAREGIVYDRAYASPLCSPSRALLVTGRYGFRTGFGVNSTGSSPFDAGLDGPSVPELVRRALAGAAPFIAWYGKWHLVASDAPGADLHPIRVGGFERFVGHLRNLGGELEDEEQPELDTHHYRWREVTADGAGARVRLVDGAQLGYDERSWASAVCQRALSADVAALAPERAALIVFAPAAPHSPQQTPPAALVSEPTAAALPAPGAYVRAKEKRRGRKLVPRATFLAQIEALDALIGRLLDELPPERRARTTVLVIGDNGTPGGLLPRSLDPAHGKGQVFEQGVAVPLIVAGPRVARPGSRCDAFVHLVDVPATAVEILGGDPLAGDGRSFAATFADPSAPGPRASAFCEIFSPNVRGEPLFWTQRALIGPRFKLVRRTLGEQVSDALYDLEADPLEKNDLLRDPGALDAAARAALERLSAELDALLAS